MVCKIQLIFQFFFLFPFIFNNVFHNFKLKYDISPLLSLLLINTNETLEIDAKLLTRRVKLKKCDAVVEELNTLE
mgnify:CR=1 FL=1